MTIDDDECGRMAERIMREVHTEALILTIDVDEKRMASATGDPDSLAVAEACMARMRRAPAA